MALIGASPSFTFRPTLFNRGLDAGLNVLGTTGRILDTPGSILRGLLAGRLDRALGGIFDAKQRVSGTELLGGRPDQFTWGGLGAELALDPVNLLTFGSLGTAGKLASRAGKLADVLKGTEGLDITAEAVARRAAAQKGLAEVLGKQRALGREAGERLAPTLAQQAKLGQRSGLALDIPFTGINVPLTSGRLGLGALTKGAELTRGVAEKVPGLPQIGRTLNTVFNPNYSRDLGRVRTGPEKATRAELNMLLTREPEALGAAKQVEINKTIEGLTKSTGLARDVVEKQLIDVLEGNKLSKLNPLDPKYPATIALRQRLSGIHPEVQKVGNDLRAFYDNLNQQAIDAGITGASDLSGNLSYYGRMLTPEARKYIAKNKEALKNNKLLRVLSNPKFVLQRRLFKDVPFNELNDTVKNQLGVDFDFFSSDIATNIGQRVKEQTRAVNQAKSIPGVMKIYGGEKEKGLKDLSNLFKDLSAKRGKTFATAFNTGQKSRFNVRVLKDAAGNEIKHTSQEDAERALNLVKELRAKFNAQPNNEHLDKIVAYIDKIAPNLDYDFVENEDIITSAMNKMGVDPGDPGKWEKAFKYIQNKLTERANTEKPGFNNTLYHGTTDKNVELAKLKGQGQGGLTVRNPNPNFRSTHLVEKPAVFFSPEFDTSATYAKGTATRWPGAQEHSKPAIEHLMKAAFIPRNVESKVKNIISNAVYLLASSGNKAQDLDEILSRVKKFIHGYDPNPMYAFSGKILNNPNVENIYNYASEFFNKNSLNPRYIEEFVNDLKRKIIDPNGINDAETVIKNQNTLTTLSKNYYQKLKNLDNAHVNEANDIAEKILRQYVALTGNPKVIKTKLSQLSLFNKLDPKMVDIIKNQDEFGKYKMSKLPEDVRKRIVENPKFASMGDDLYESQILAHGNEGDVVPFGLLKDTKTNKTIEGSIERISKPDKIVRWSTNAGKKEISNALEEAGITNRFVDKNTYKDISKFFATPKDPEIASGALKFLDNVNAVYRGALTTLFPAYHVRNMMSGAFMNVLGGVKDPSLYRIATKDLVNMPAAKKISLESSGVLGKGLHEETYRMLMNSQFGKSLGKRNPAFKAYSLGKQAGQAVDNLNRYVMYLDGIKKGLSETEAVDRVLKYHFDYSDLTTVEKLGLRRGFLFYTFMRKNIPLMLKSLVENPRVMQAYNRSVGGTNANLKQPDWLGDAFYAGYDTKGNMQRLQLGLPAEDLRRFGTHDEGLQRLSGLLFSLLSPVVTAPAEMLFNKNLYYNKPMEGNLLQRLADVSPISRFTGTAERAAKDPGKEAFRFLTSLNLKSFNKKDLDRNIKIQELQKALRAKAKAGKAREFSVFSSEDPETKQLNSMLNKAFKG